MGVFQAGSIVGNMILNMQGWTQNVTKVKADTKSMATGLDSMKASGDKAASAMGGLMGVMGKIGAAIGIEETVRRTATAIYEMNAGVKTLQDTTGATGAAMAALTQSYTNVMRTVEARPGDVADIMGLLTQRTDQKGAGLENLTGQLAELDNVSKETGMQVVGPLLESFARWGVATGEQSRLLDYLFKASQKSGTGISQLTTNITEFYPQLQKMGFGLNDAISLFAQLDKSGANTAKVMFGVQTGLAKISVAGLMKGVDVDIEKAWNDIYEAIKTSTDAIGNQIADKIFGGRAGAQLATSIRAGTFEVEGMTAALSNCDDAIRGAVENTKTWWQAFGEVKNVVVSIMAEMAKPFQFKSVQGYFEGLDKAIGSIVARFMYVNKATKLTLAPSIGPTMDLNSPDLQASLQAEFGSLNKPMMDLRGPLERLGDGIKGGDIPDISLPFKKAGQAAQDASPKVKKYLDLLGGSAGGGINKADEALKKLIADIKEFESFMTGNLGMTKLFSDEDIKRMDQATADMKLLADMSGFTAYDDAKNAIEGTIRAMDSLHKQGIVISQSQMAIWGKAIWDKMQAAGTDACNVLISKLSAVQVAAIAEANALEGVFDKDQAAKKSGVDKFKESANGYLDIGNNVGRLGSEIERVTGKSNTLTKVMKGIGEAAKMVNDAITAYVAGGGGVTGIINAVVAVAVDALGLMESAAAKIQLGMDRVADEIATKWNGLADSLTDKIVTFFETGKWKAGEFAKEVVDSFAKIMIKWMVIQPMMQAMGIPATAFAAKGLAFDRGNIIPFASGGVVSRPTIAPMAMFGEAGPEAIMPLKRDASGRLGVSGSGSSVIVNINDYRTNGAPVAVTESTGPNGQRQLEIVLRDAINGVGYQGGIDGLMRQRYGVRPVTA